MPLTLHQAQWQQTVVHGHLASRGMILKGGRDADVCTRSDRQTQVHLRTSNVRADDQWKYILVDVYYSVKEMHNNYTFLEWNGTAKLSVPIDSKKRSVRFGDVRNVDNSWIVRGTSHEPMELVDVANTVVFAGTYRIDGKGDDYTNAGFELELAVPIAYRDQF